MLDKALEWFDRISKTPLKNRIFVLMLFMVFLLVATNVTTWIHLTNKEKEANTLRIQAETDLKILQSTNLNDNKTYNQNLVIEIEKCHKEAQLAIQAERALNKQVQDERYNELKDQLTYLKGESKRIKQEAKTIKQKVSI